MAAEILAAQALKASLGSDADDAELFADMIEGETSLAEMVDAVFANIQIDQELLDGIEARENDLAIRKARIKERIGWRKAKIEQAILIYGEKIERPEATFTLSQRQASVVITDEAHLPSAYWKMTPEIDRKALRAALAEGKDIPGAVLNNAPQTLTIRRK